MISNKKQVNCFVDFYNFKIILFAISTISFLLMLIIPYDREFKSTAILPLFFLFIVYTCINKNILMGIGGCFLVLTYTFRMTLLPILCAFGNFYLEPDKFIYIKNFSLAIILMCIECLTVFIFLNIFFKHSNRSNSKEYIELSKEGSDNVILIFVVLSFLLYLILFLLYPNILFSHYRILFVSVDSAREFDLNHAYLQEQGKPYYIITLLDLISRGVISFYFVSKFLNKNTRIGLTLAIIITVMNFLIVSDRRILSYLIGLTCFIQIINYIENERAKKKFYFILLILSICTVIFSFLDANEPWRVARKFQRYFSGPSLTAIGISVYNNFLQTPIDFFKLLFNDSYILRWLFGPFPITGYVKLLCGDEGYSIWTPMFIGSIQYFHGFGPFLIIFIVKYITHNDYRLQYYNSDLKKMILIYMNISMAIYMIMYTIELLFYNMIFIGGLYNLLIFFDRRATHLNKNFKVKW